MSINVEIFKKDKLLKELSVPLANENDWKNLGECIETAQKDLNGILTELIDDLEKNKETIETAETPRKKMKKENAKNNKT